MALTSTERSARYRERHPERAREQSRAHRERNIDKKRAQCVEWEKLNRERRNEYWRERYANDPEYRAKKLEEKDRDEVREKSREYMRNKRATDAEFVARMKEARKTEQAKELARNYQKNKRSSDPAYRVAQTIHARLRRVLRGRLSKSWVDLVGYDAKELRAHLEAQFEDWMTWENYGSEWHIDHIRPVVSFNLPDEIAECWALKNLRPLSAKENMSKGKKII